MKAIPLKFSILVLALTAPFTLTQCISTGGTGGGTVSAGNLATPNHSLSKSDYPFDEQGNYREDWVRYPGGASTGSSSSKKKSSSSSGSSRTTSSTPKPAPAPKPTPSPSSSPTSRTYTVVSGDTLWGISRQYGVTVPSLQAKNGITTTNIRPGQRLKIP
ncbi:MAG: nucleoid-associated protein YgaU [Verrucomicrobiales bacterium]|jgi:nucleoid-associated protein YgaU